MRLKTLSWFALSLLLFMAAWYFWRLGDQRAQVPPSPTNHVAPAGLSTNVSMANSPAAQAAVPAAPAPADARNPFPYRLSNTTESIGALTRNESAVLLANALYDTRLAARPEIPPHLRAQGDPESYIVQARGPIDDAFRKSLAQAGATIVSYVPNNAYLVRVSAAGAQRLAGLPRTQAVLPFEPYYKFDQRLLAKAVQKIPLPEDTRLNVLIFPGERDRALELFAQLGAEVLAEERTPFGQSIVVQTRAGNLITLAGHPVVQGLSGYYERRPANDLTRQRLRISTNTVTAAPGGNYRGLTGAGVQMNMNDTGVYADHPDLTPARVTGFTFDPGGHGTHVAGIILGNGSKSATVTKALGSTNGANFRGMAPAARILSQEIAGGLYTDEDLQAGAALTNALISNNSWTYQGANVYDIHSASYDAAVRDALPGVTGEQPQLLVFSGGNGGGGGPGGLGGIPGSIDSPATAKNVITVGGTELPRYITNLVVDAEGNTNSPFLGYTDSDDQVIGFSSRGNVGIGQEGTYGRFKPDVVAPGAMLVSCSAPTFVYPTNFGGASVNNFRFLVLPGLSTNLFTVDVPANGTMLTIRVTTNTSTGGVLPPVNIMAPDTTNFLGVNVGTLAPPTLVPGTVSYYLGNPGSSAVNIDLQVSVDYTNAAGNYFTVLSNLNSGLGSFYRYESGVSMATAAISGTLALMQEFFATTLHLTNSPALSKALLINGARSMNVLYNLEANAVVNHQGWGLANITNSIPLTMTAGGGPVRFFEQSPTNALTTGQSQTRVVTVASSGQAAPLRVTLVWTDPPGNPVTGVKLVNDLDLIVTNLTTGDVYVGNNMQGNFTQTSGTNGLDLSQITDRVNNVENVYIPGPLGTSYSVTVSARRVNVNAVNNHPDGVVQDYALVISSGDVSAANPNPFTITPQAVANHPGAIVLGFPTNSSPILNLRVGANSPLVVSTNGVTNQWNFFVFTNTTAFTNVAFVTFLPPNLSRSRYREADLDLYVTVGDPGLTNLNPASVAAADKSLRRLGTEYITYSNSAQGTIYYVGVKSEDQQAANYGIFGTASLLPFNGRDENGNQVLRGFALPAEIPDGTPEQPMGVTIIAIGQPDTIQRVIVTNILTHEEGGDLFGNLSHNERFAVLNDHRTFFDTQLFIYDDSQQADPFNTGRTDGPGSLNDFVGDDASGVWVLSMSDNAQFHTGRVDLLTILIEPTTRDNNNPGGINITRPILPETFLYSAINVPPDAVNLQVCVSGITDPVQLVIRNGDFPSLTTYDYSITVNPPGLCVDISPGDSPPLTAGRWFIGVYNPNPTTVSATLTATVTRNLSLGRTITYSSTDTPLSFLDDAVTNSIITVTNAGIIAGIKVGVRIDHPRASDLVLHLTSPRGTRLMLAENRGSTNALGYGATVITTNVGFPPQYVYTTFTDDTNLACVPIKFGLPPFINNGCGSLTAPGGLVMFSTFEGVPYSFSNSVGAILGGWEISSGTADIVSDGHGIVGFSYHGTNAVDLNGTTSGTIFTNIPTVIGRDYVLSFAYSRNPGGPAVVTGNVNIDGSTLLGLTYSGLTTYNNLNWSNGAVAFTASNATTRVEFQSTVAGDGGLYLDAISVVQLPLNGNFFLPEEPLAPLIGEEALGNWSLEIWDNRAGGALTNAQLLAWQLQITYPNTNPPTTRLTNNIVSTNTFVGPGTVYFLVNLPCANTTVTNTLTGLLGGPFNLLFNQAVLPTGTGPGDVILLGNTANGTSVLTGGTPPLLLPGFFYLGVSSTNTGTNSFTLRIDFDTTNCTAFVPLTACSLFSTNIPPGNALQIFQFPVSSNAVQANFELINLDGNVDLFVTRGAYPTVSVYDYASTNLSTTDELVVVLTNSAPVPLTNDFWYVGVRNRDAAIVNYSVRITEILAPSILPLTNGIAFTNTISPPCNTDYYRFTVSSNSVEGRFEILAPSGDVNLYVTRGLPLPVGTNYHYAGLNPGTANEFIRVTNGSPVALTNGDWYLAVVNVTNAPVTYAVRATEFSAPTPLSACTGVATNIAAGTSLQYFTYPVSSNAVQVNFELIALGGNVDLLVQPGSFPTPGTFAYASLQSGTGAELVSVATNSSTPLTAGIWYLGVVNSSAANVTYTVRVTEILASDLVPLTNGVYYGTTVPALCREDHYRFTVSAAAVQAFFEISGPSGNVDLYLRRGLPLPAGTNFHYASVNPGAAAEQIIVRTSSSPIALAPGDWYLTVVNQTAGPVSYSVRASENAPPVLILPPNTNILELVPFTATATATDPDIPANTLTFALVSGPAGLTVSPAGVINWTPTELQGPSVNPVVISVTDDGVPSLSTTNSFAITVSEANTPPVLTLPPGTNINELVLFTATATAADADLPANTLTFALVSGPTGLTVSPAGLISWTPSEAQGPSTNDVRIRVFDDGVPSLSATNLFVITVNEVNVAPVLPPPPNTNITALVPFTATATATDADLPANVLTFALISGPTNLTVSPAGVINWTPAEEQGPGTYPVFIRVFDDGAPSLGATNSFVIVVNQANTAPKLFLPADTNITELLAFTVTATATDSDVPTNSLTFALVSGPTNLTVSPAGVINWTPSEAQGPSTNIVKIRVFDDGSPSLSATNSFVITVLETNSAPVLILPPTTNIAELTLFTATAIATDSDLPTNALTFALVSGPTNLTVSPAGAINWTPAEEQGPSTNIVVISVTDDGVPSLSTTDSFVIIVRPVNTPPVLTLPANTNIVELTLFTATATATDSDVPADVLTFALVSGPAGLSVSPAGVINWTPSEAQGPGINIVVIRVFDDGVPSISVTNSFVITVSETNSAPVLILPPNTNINELVLFTATATATDSDLPANVLTFALVSGPTNLTVSPAGVINWTPSEAQGPSTNIVKIRVFDDGVPSLSVTNSFVITVSEANVAPVFIATPPDVTINGLATLTVTNGATDSDLPANVLTYALQSPPTGALIDPGTGLITWTPSALQSPSTNTFTTVVTDNGLPALSATNSFVVIVNSIVMPADFMITVVTNGLKLTWTAPSYERFMVDWTGDIAPPRTWTTFTNLVTSTNGSFSFTDDGSQTGGLGGLRFYRLFYVP